jgi:hypothetical protein
LKLAKWAIGLSVVLGLICLPYSFVTELALTQQANSFLMDDGPDSGLFPRLLRAGTNQKEFDQAFLLTTPPTDRANAKPGNEEAMYRQFDAPVDSKSEIPNPGKLTYFRTHPFVLLFTLAEPGEISIEPLAVQDWKYEGRSYQVTRNYRITMARVTLEVPIVAYSSEGGEGEQRKWYAGLPDVKQLKVLRLQEGELMVRLSQLARGYLNERLKKQHAGDSFGKFESLDDTDWKAVTPKDLKPELVRREIARAFDIFISLGVAEQEIPLGKKDKDRFQFFYACRLAVMEPVENLPPLALFGTVVVQTAEAFDPATATTSPTWEIHKIKFSRVYPGFRRK